MSEREWLMSLAIVHLACATNGDERRAELADAAVGSEADASSGGNGGGGGVDMDPQILFRQEGLRVGLDRSDEPASAGPFTSMGTLAYGGWLADFDGDSLLDYYGVNHAQPPHRSGLFINDGAGGFGQNLFTVALQPSPASWPNMDNSNEMRFVGDLTGDGRVDFFFAGWIGLGVMCANQGVVERSDWTGPEYLCFGTTDAVAFADVNGDGRIDILGLDPAGFDPYTAYYANTASYLWRLNSGDPNLQSWPVARNFLDLRVTDPSSPHPAFVDLNGDTFPDKIVGIPLPPERRGPNGTWTDGKRVFLGQADGSYVEQTGAGLEEANEPISVIEDVDEDGCLDLGTDSSGYRDNQNWFVQNRTGDSCDVTFTSTPRTAFPFYPGFRRYTVDIDNSGLMSKLVIVHTAYGHQDGHPGGVTIYRKRPDGGYEVIGSPESGIDIDGTAEAEFYADNLSPGDWNEDGRLDLGGTGSWTIPDSDSGYALWTSELETTNSWIKVSLPTVTGFFVGSATIEVFDLGYVGESAHQVTAPRRFYAGRTWATQVHHLGIGTRSQVDVRVTFPDGEQVVHAGVEARQSVVIRPDDSTVSLR